MLQINVLVDKTDCPVFLPVAIVGELAEFDLEEVEFDDSILDFSENDNLFEKLFDI